MEGLGEGGLAPPQPASDRPVALHRHGSALYTDCVDTKKIRFVANRHWLTEQSASRPEPAGRTIPDWYRKALRFVPDAATGQPMELPDGGGKIPTWRACPALYDVMGSGYMYRTPCDIEFMEDANGVVHGRVLDEQFSQFLLEREPLPQFVCPAGYHQKHFAWWPDWAVELPAGYSALYMQPLNRFELPFLTTSGIIDNDKLFMPGTMPFFFLKGMSGVLPAGTPYAQIFPFKRESWESDFDVSITEPEQGEKYRKNAEYFRQPDGGIYLKEVWERRTYK